MQSSLRFSWYNFSKLAYMFGVHYSTHTFIHYNTHFHTYMLSFFLICAPSTLLFPICVVPYLAGLLPSLRFLLSCYRSSIAILCPFRFKHLLVFQLPCFCFVLVLFAILSLLSSHHHQPGVEDQTRAGPCAC